MISIVIPAWNQQEMTDECIASVIENTQKFELIVVDNGSDPPIELGEGWLNVTCFGSAGREYISGGTSGNRALVLRNDENLGFPAAVNQGIRAAKGDVIVLLNNDVIVTPGWSERLLTHLETCSIVGPLTNYSAGVQRTVIPVYEDAEELYANAKAWGEKYDGQSMEVNWLIGFCFAFDRSLFDELGAFDESMWPSSGEEIDFCLRARKAGHVIRVARDIYVHHEGSKTFRDLESAGIMTYKAACENSGKHLAYKWGDDFWFKQTVVEAGEGLRINVGCGRFPLNGFVNIDREAEVEPDVVCDVTDLPYDVGTVDEIYAGHILEHFDWYEGEKVLGYWYSLLKPGGKISVSVPDFDVFAAQYLEKKTPEAMREMNDTYIYSYKQKSPHRYAYSAGLLEEVMGSAGFVDLKRMPVDHPYFPHPVVWQVGIEGVKR
jgi:GT2 family glycosyltransferase/predicted SAM-dependent methyltransferase